ncbi:MAG TPA: tetratricopeptide repeat protein [Bacteroidales bacterium]|nr:tetratricopeptide repeat protein [Bacteroidales bacterium]
MKRDRRKIQKYLDHELSEKDMKRFEADLESSPELLAETELFREVDEALSDSEVLSFRDQLSDLRTETKKDTGPSKKPVRFSKPWHYAATAVIALLLAIGLAAILDKPLSNKELLKRYYKPYEVALINRSADSELNLMLQHAERLYLDGEFEEAVFYFEKVLEKQPDQVATNLYSGISYFELEQYREAGLSFNKVIEHNDNLYIEQAEWYLGLCFLATDELDRARRQFARIASSNSDKSKEAEKLLKKIKK